MEAISFIRTEYRNWYSIISTVLPWPSSVVIWNQGGDSDNLEKGMETHSSTLVWEIP